MNSDAMALGEAMILGTWTERAVWIAMGVAFGVVASVEMHMLKSAGTDRSMAPASHTMAHVNGEGLVIPARAPRPFLRTAAH